MNGCQTMKFSLARALCLGGLLGMLLTWPASGEAVGDYRVILERNPFGLKPPPAPPAAPPPTHAEPAKPTNYKLSGLTALFKPPRAMFVNQVPGKNPEYVSLSEGQRQGAIEVLADGIDIPGGTVRVKIDGEERTMSFKEDGLKGPSGPPVMTARGVPVPLGMPNPVPATPLGSKVAPPNYIPIPQPYTPPRPTGQQFNAVPSGVVPMPAVPNMQRPMRIDPNTIQQNATSPPPAPNIDPAEQALRIEINRKLTEVQVQRGELPPLPGTDLSPLLQQAPPIPGGR